MRTKLFIFQMLLFCCTFVHCQNMISTKEINGQIYTYNSKSKTIENKTNYLMQSEGNIIFADPNKCYFDFDTKLDQYSLYKSVFSKERVQELQNNNIAMNVIVNSSGKIIEIVFYLRNDINLISLKEIYLLETYLKSANLSFRSECDDSSIYYQMIMKIQFKHLFENYDSL